MERPALTKPDGRELLRDVRTILPPPELDPLAGTEVGTGSFANDALPEARARELQDVPVDLGAEEEDA